MWNNDEDMCNRMCDRKCNRRCNGGKKICVRRVGVVGGEGVEASLIIRLFYSF